MEERKTYEVRRKCWRKRWHFKTIKAARKKGREITKVDGIKLYVYECSSCGEYHLTKKLSGKGQVL